MQDEDIALEARYKLWIDEAAKELQMEMYLPPNCE